MNSPSTGFDPFSDRLARDIRNSLSSALVAELAASDIGAIARGVKRWKAGVLASVYLSYLEDRCCRYDQVINEIHAAQIKDPCHQAVFLWNHGLFFEVHELLETVWQHADGPERIALKGWIQAAGVYVHYQRGKPETARGLAKRAVVHLQNARDSLDFIANLEQLIDALNHPTDAAPQLLFGSMAA